MNDHTHNPYSAAFFIVPSYILDLPGLTLGYLKVYEAIFQFWNHNKSCFLSEKSLCERSKLKRSQVYDALNFFEKYGEIKRIHKGLKRFLVRPEKSIETDCANIKSMSARADVSTKTSQSSARADIDVRCSGHETSALADYNNKNRTKENKVLLTVVPPDISSSSQFIFSEEIDNKILDQKLDVDTRSDEEFMNEVITHVDEYSDLQYERIVRGQAAIKMLIKLKRQGKIFKVSGKPKNNKPKQETIEERNARYQREKEEQNKRIYGD